MSKYKDFKDKIIGNIKVIELSNDKFDSNGTTRLWKCKCKCGQFFYKSARHLNEALKKNINLSCGCSAYVDYIGKKFGDYTVKQFVKSENKKRYWLCECKCGDIAIKDTSYLTKCKYVCQKLKKQNTALRAKIKNILKGMKDRCYNEKCDAYKNYGGRGIKICDEWLINNNKFIEWAIKNGYKSGLSIDRIDNDGNYEPNNCRWADVFIQANNKRNNINIEYNGEKKCLRKWCRELGLPYRKTHKRIFMYNWSIEKCFDKKERVGFI